MFLVQGACDHAHVHICMHGLYVCVGGVRASHLRGTRWCIPCGPQREIKIKEMDLKTWNREGRPKQPHGQYDALSFVFPQNAEQQQHQQHPRLQLQPHAQTPDFVRYYQITILNAGTVYRK